MVTLESEQKADLRNDEVGRDVLSLRDFVRIISERLWLLTVVTLALVGVAVGFSLTQTPTYESSVKVLVYQQPTTGNSDSLANLGNNIQGLQQFTATLTVAVDSRPVAEAVTERLNLDTTPNSLLENLEAQQIPETQFIEVTYRDSDPERAQLVVNTVGEVFTELVTKISPDANGVRAIVWEPAMVPDSPVSPNLKLNILMALVLGLTLGLVLAFLSEYLAVRGANVRGEGPRQTKPRAADSTRDSDPSGAARS
jgi:capsular polysaccharide biosynthesis protein